MKVLWGAARNKIKNDLKSYDNMIEICVGLTNFHITRHPLRSADSQANRRLSMRRTIENSTNTQGSSNE